MICIFFYNFDGFATETFSITLQGVDGETTSEPVTVTAHCPGPEGCESHGLITCDFGTINGEAVLNDARPSHGIVEMLIQDVGARTKAFPIFFYHLMEAE